MFTVTTALRYQTISTLTTTVLASAAGAAGAETLEGLELQFSGVSARVESRPRAGAHALHVALGGVRLRSRLTPRSLFPVLVAPQGLIRAGLSAAAARAPRAAPPPPPAGAEPLFQLSYERRPAGLNCDYKYLPPALLFAFHLSSSITTL